MWPVWIYLPDGFHVCPLDCLSIERQVGFMSYRPADRQLQTGLFHPFKFYVVTSRLFFANSFLRHPDLSLPFATKKSSKIYFATIGLPRHNTSRSANRIYASYESKRSTKSGAFTPFSATVRLGLLLARCFCRCATVFPTPNTEHLVPRRVVQWHGKRQGLQPMTLRIS